MKINKKDIMGVRWFAFLIIILIFLIIGRFIKANNSTAAYERSLKRFETEYQQSLDEYSNVNDSALDQEIIKEEWIEKINLLDKTLSEVNAKNNKFDSDIENQNELTDDLDQNLTRLENDEFNPYEVNFSLDSSNNIQLIRNIPELKELGITSVSDFSNSDPLTSITLDVILNREKNFYEKSLTANHAVIEGFYNNYKNDLFMDGNVILQITRDELVPLLYRTITLDDLNEKIVDDIVFSNLSQADFKDKSQ